MTATLIAPELEKLPNRLPLPVEAYHQLMNLGFMEGRFKILDGEPVGKKGQIPRRANMIARIARLLANLCDFYQICKTLLGNRYSSREINIPVV